MSCTATIHEIKRFRDAVSQRIGLQFDDAKLAYLSEVFQRRVAKCGRGSAAYLQQLEYELSDDEISALAGELTVAETYFFRNHEQFEALAEVALPERLRLRAPQKTFRLLSAGCSSGEEAYSMAIIAREMIVDPTWKVAIRAVDVNAAVLEKARRGRYSAWALRETREDIRGKWFRVDGREMVRKQQAKSWELRAAMSMAQLWRDQGKPQEARELLAPVYGWFSEGFGTLDLKEAKSQLDELHA